MSVARQSMKKASRKTTIQVDDDIEISQRATASLQVTYIQHIQKCNENASQKKAMEHDVK